MDGFFLLFFCIFDLKRLDSGSGLRFVLYLFYSLPVQHELFDFFHGAWFISGGTMG